MGKKNETSDISKRGARKRKMQYSSYGESCKYLVLYQVQFQADVFNHSSKRDWFIYLLECLGCLLFTWFPLSKLK